MILTCSTTLVAAPKQSADSQIFQMADTLWEIDRRSPNLNHIKTSEWEEARSYRWANNPVNPDQLLLIDGKVAHIFDWQNLERLTREEGISLDAKIDDELMIRSIIPCFHNTSIATAFGASTNRHCKSRLLVWNASDFTPNSTSAVPMAKYQHLSDDIDFLIHADDQKLVFLHSDNWICSTDPDREGNFIRHFFLPADWLTSNIDLMIEMTPAENILFVKGDEVAVVKRGLREVNSKHTNNARRPSPLGNGRRHSSQISLSEIKVNFMSFQEPEVVSSDTD
jgi:hypothetical protein